MPTINDGPTTYDLEPLFRLAARLGIEPLGEDEHSWVEVADADGRRLDPVAVVNALLDRLDQITGSSVA